MNDSLKRKILDNFARSESEKLKILLQDIQFGDKRPIQLLQEMFNLASDRINDEIIRTLWLQRLPVQVQQILSICKDPLSDLAKIADKISEISCIAPMITEVQSERSQFQMLREEISSLQDSVHRLLRSFKRGGR